MFSYRNILICKKTMVFRIFFYVADEKIEPQHVADEENDRNIFLATHLLIPMSGLYVWFSPDFRPEQPKVRP